MPSTRELIAALRVLAQGMDRTLACRVIMTVLLLVVAGLLAGLAPLALKGMIDAAGIPPAQRSHAASQAMMTFAAAYLFALCGGRLLTELRPGLVSAVEQRLYARLRQRVFDHLLALPLPFHLRSSTGAVVQGLQQAISGYQVIVFNLVHSIVPVLVELVTVAFVLASLAEPAIIATFAASALAYVAILGWPRSGFHAAAQGVTEASVDMHGLMTDSLLNVETIKCFGAEPTARDRFGKSVDRLERCWAALQRRRLGLGLAATVSFALSMTVSLAVAIHAVMQGTLTTGGFVLANVCMLQVLRPLETLGGAVRDVGQSLAFIRPLIQVLQERSEAGPTDDRAPTHADDDTSNELRLHATKIGGRRTPGIVFDNVYLSYEPGMPVLRGFSLEIPAGRSVAIVGASGSGKSSLVRVLLRLCEPQAGRVLLDGIDIGTLSLGALRSMMAIVPQDTILFDDSIAFNIGIAKPGATRAEIEQAAHVADIHDMVAALPARYATRIGERGLRLSGGERQRIAIARAVLKDSRILLFDEATSMLGSLTERAILRRLAAIAAGRTTITIAHRLATVRHADEIVVLDRGSLAERGDHASLLARDGLYATMWRAQHGGGA